MPNPTYLTWEEWFFIYLVIIIVSTIIFAISSILRFVRRGFEIELYEYTNIEYKDFLRFLGEEKRNCALEYRGYTIKIETQRNGYLCGIYGQSGLVSQQIFETLQGLIEAKIISSQTLEEIWNEVEFQDASGIIKNS